MENRVISVYFEKQLYKKIGELAKEKGIAKPAVIRQMVKECLQKKRQRR